MKQPAHIEDMGRLFFIFGIIISIVLLLFLPIFLETNAYYDMNGRKFAFSVSAYKFLPIIGGYIATYPGGLAFHISEKKAIVLPYQKVASERKRFSIMKIFRLKALAATVETGPEYLLPAYLAQTVTQIYKNINNNPKQEFENKLWLTNGDVLKISLNLLITFNLFKLLSAFLKFLKEKIKLLCQRKTKK